jgi:hypothetical protein
MLTSEETNILGNIIDTSWGKSSAVEGQPASRGLKWNWLGEGQILGTCSYIIHLSSYQHMEKDRTRARQEAESIVDNSIKDIKASFKADAGRTLKTKEQNTEDTVEVFKGVPGPAYFKYKVILEVE